jgi:nucleotidyltransferase/DNA polymerase involved in DNA repair
MPDHRQLGDLAGIGKAALQDFKRLEVHSVAQLAACDADELYTRLGAMDGQLHDICVLDTFACAIAQARNPNLPAEQRQWWWWSRQRKAVRGE